MRETDVGALDILIGALRRTRQTQAALGGLSEIADSDIAKDWLEAQKTTDELLERLGRLFQDCREAQPAPAYGVQLGIVEPAEEPEEAS